MSLIISLIAASGAVLVILAILALISGINEEKE